jgi:hypothetical protein
MFPNPASFEITPEQLTGWYQNARQIRAHPGQNSKKAYEFATTVKMCNLILPNLDAAYAPGTNPINEPKLFVKFTTRKFRNVNLISTIGAKNHDVQHVAVLDKEQNSGTTKWLHYKCNFEQTMRFSRDHPLEFEIRRQDGTTLVIADSALPLPPITARQVHATFEITPYIRDADFDNHNLETVSG